MLRWRTLACFVLATLAGAGCTAPDAANRSTNGTGGFNRPGTSERDYVVLVSFDGFRRDYLDLHDTPHFDALGRAGLMAEALISVFPSQTFSAHYTIATGLYPARHGIVNNRFFDPRRQARFSFRDRSAVQDGSWYDGEPIWVTAERQGLTTAAFFFPGTEAPIGGIQPSRWRAYDGTVPNLQRIDAVVRWLELPPDERPHLITVYFSLVDHAGHRFGPESAELAQAVAEADGVLGALAGALDSLPHGNRVHLIVVSDHGMADVVPGRRLVLADIVDVRGAWVEPLGPGVSIHVDGDRRRAAALVAAFNRAVDPGDARAYLRGDAPVHLHVGENPRYGDALVIPNLGVVVQIQRGQVGPTATHGWDPTLPAMHGILLARGPGIPHGQRLPPFESIHVYPLIAHLLELAPALDIDGDLAVWRPYIASASRTPPRRQQTALP